MFRKPIAIVNGDFRRCPASVWLPLLSLCHILYRMETHLTMLYHSIIADFLNNSTFSATSACSEVSTDRGGECACDCSRRLCLLQHKCEQYVPDEQDAEETFGDVTVTLSQSRQVCPDFTVRKLAVRYTGPSGSRGEPP